MKRSSQVAAPLLAAAALSLLTGCQKDMQRCVDEHNNVVPDSYCRDEPHPTGFVPRFRYYYGGWGGWGLGTHVEGGSYLPTAGRSYTTRGGFGSFFGEMGGHGGGGEAGHAGS